MFINEVDNDAATKALDVAISFLRKNPSYGISVQVTAVEGNRTDSKGLLEAGKISLEKN